MKKTIQIVLAALSLASASGCATPYMIDRRRDAADIFTLGLGVGLGVKVRVGPLQTGLLAESDQIALRGGQICGCDAMPVLGLPTNFDLEALMVGIEEFCPTMQGEDSRSKYFNAIGGVVSSPSPYPFWHCAVVDDFHTKTKGLERRHVPYYYSQIEVVVACLGSVRVGFNPGELLDFVLGWFRIDIFNDDLEAKKVTEKSNQSSEATSPKRASPQ